GGRLKLWHAGRLSDIAGIPPVDTREQDGLMDIALHPQFAGNRTLYFTYSKNGGTRGDTTVLATAQYGGHVLSGVRDLLVTDAGDPHGGTSGPRFLSGPDAPLLSSVGDRHTPAPAQDLTSHKGKILRLNDDGTVPRDNPFVNRTDA